MPTFGRFTRSDTDEIPIKSGSSFWANAPEGSSQMAKAGDADVERNPEKAGVDGSTPSLATM